MSKEFGGRQPIHSGTPTSEVGDNVIRLDDHRPKGYSDADFATLSDAIGRRAQDSELRIVPDSEGQDVQIGGNKIIQGLQKMRDAGIYLLYGDPEDHIA